MTNDDEYHEGIFGSPARPMPTPEWVKLIPADSIPVFVFPIDLPNVNMHLARDHIKAALGARKFILIRGAVDIYAIADQPAPPSACICGGDPHASHCPANRDPFLRGLL